ncbi:MAG: hypothetical protein LBH17_06680 [Oscillospiraceae bacterium]|nr:hypothetical protein [Oscillospiraceae bacterium]
MDGIKKILERIRADSLEECAAIAAEAEARRAEIAERYQKEEKQAYADALSKGAVEAGARFERLKNVAELEARKQILSEKQTLVTEAFQHAVKLLRALPEGDYIALLSRLAAAVARTGTEELIFSPADRARVGEAVTAGANAILAAGGWRAELTLSAAEREIGGGVIVSGGDIETNCSLETLVFQYKNELSPRVAEILFE